MSFYDQPEKNYALILELELDKRQLNYVNTFKKLLRSIPVLVSFRNRKILKKVQPAPRSIVQRHSIENLEFIEGAAEKLEIENNTADMIVCAQSAHWFGKYRWTRNLQQNTEKK